MQKKIDKLLNDIKANRALIKASEKKSLGIEQAIIDHNEIIEEGNKLQDTTSDLKNEHVQILAHNAMGATTDTTAILNNISKAKAADDKANKSRISNRVESERVVACLQGMHASEQLCVENIQSSISASHVDVLNLMAIEQAGIYELNALVAVEALRKLIAIDTCIGIYSQDHRKTSGLLWSNGFDLIMPALRNGKTIDNLNRGIPNVLIDTDKYIITDRGHSERISEVKKIFAGV
ncbi:MAG: hypothetical protein WCS87_03980 [Methylococcaceae bacterium]